MMENINIIIIKIISYLKKTITEIHVSEDSFIELYEVITVRVDQIQ